jgi:hypothetical protein
MSASGPVWGLLDAFIHPGATMIPSSHSHSPMKCSREESPPASDSDEGESDENRMDFQPTKNITPTQAIGDENDDRTYDIPQFASPASADHAALRADFEIITAAAMEYLYNRITNDINKTTTLVIEKATGPLHN